MPILTHLGARFDSPETFFLVICNIFINMVKCQRNIDYKYPLNYVSLSKQKLNLKAIAIGVPEI